MGTRAEARYGFVSGSLVTLALGALSIRPMTVHAEAAADAPTANVTSVSGLDEIIVTAQRRKENLQEAPISVTALTAETLQDFGVRDFEDYAKSVPNLSFGMGGSPYGGVAYGISSTREIIIRGVSGANTTSLYIDDTPIPNVIDPRVLDLERVEVLRGPQGTLFGASSMGGTVRLITKTPSLTDTYGSVDAETYDINAGGGGFDVSGTLNLPMSSGNTALRLSGFYVQDPGYFTRIYGVPTVPGVPFQPGQQVMGSTKIGATNEYGGSASILVKPEAIPGLTLTPLIMWQGTDTTGYPLADNEASNFTQDRPLNVYEGTGGQWQFYALTGAYDASFGRFISSTSFLHRYSQDSEDGTSWFALFQGYYYTPLPYVPTPVHQFYDTRQKTQELRFESQFAGPVQIVAGLFYQSSALEYQYAFITLGANSLSGGYLGNDNNYLDNLASVQKQTAGFFDVSYKLGNSLEFSAGVRKAYLKYSGGEGVEQYPVLDANSAFSFDLKEQPVTPRFVAKYTFDEDDILYASASKGFRIGGVNPPATGACAQDAQSLGLPVGPPIPYYSDSLWSYEVGVKNLWDDRRIATRAAVYRIDWSNIQQTLVLPTCGIGEELNAGAARIKGAEAEVSARLTSALQLDAGVGYEDGSITEAASASGVALGFPVGSPLSNVPKWTASVRSEFTKPVSMGQAFVRAEYSFVGTSLSLANGGSGLYRSEYSLVDMRTGLRANPWSYTLFCKNLFNRAANYGDVVTAVGIIPDQSRIAVAQPRTIGLDISRSFGASP